MQKERHSSDLWFQSDDISINLDKTVLVCQRSALSTKFTRAKLYTKLKCLPLTLTAHLASSLSWYRPGTGGWSHRWPSPLQGSASSAPRWSEPCRCRWGSNGGFLVVPATPCQTGSPEAPTAAVRQSSAPTCSRTACSQKARPHNGFLCLNRKHYQHTLICSFCRDKTPNSDTSQR